MRLINPILALLLIGTANAAARIRDVFQVDTRDPTIHHSSCLQRAEPKKSDSLPLYNPDTTARDAPNLFNQFFTQVSSLNQHVLSSIEEDKYDKNLDTRKLMASFWAIKPDTAKLGDDQSSLSYQKYKEMKRRYTIVRDLIEKPRRDGPDKTKIFCDGTYMKLQRGDDTARNKHGKEYHAREDGKPITLSEFEAGHGRTFDDSWYFWYDFGDEHGYIVIDKRTEPALSETEDYPWPIDSRTGEPSVCMDPYQKGYTIGLEMRPSDSTGGTDAWLKGAHVILCPRSFKQRQFYQNALTPKAQPEGTHLDTRGITALTFYHELFHVANPSNSEDHSVLTPKRVEGGRRDPRWPNEKDAFNAQNPAVEGAVQCMTLAMYELAKPETTSLARSLAIYDPECYAWFSLTLALQNVGGGQDWSTGAARPRGSKPSIVTASIPGVEMKRSKPTDVPLLNGVFEEPGTRGQEGADTMVVEDEDFTHGNNSGQDPVLSQMIAEALSGLH